MTSVQKRVVARIRDIQLRICAQLEAGKITREEFKHWMQECRDLAVRNGLTWLVPVMGSGRDLDEAEKRLAEQISTGFTTKGLG